MPPGRWLRDDGPPGIGSGVSTSGTERPGGLAAGGNTDGLSSGGGSDPDPGAAGGSTVGGVTGTPGGGMFVGPLGRNGRGATVASSLRQHLCLQPAPSTAPEATVESKRRRIMAEP